MNVTGGPVDDRPKAGSPASWRRTIAAFGLAGLIVGLAWRLLAVPAARLGDGLERAVAPDGTFFLLAALGGVLTGAYVVSRPPGRQAAGLAAALMGGVVAGLIAIGVNRWTAGPQLQAWAGVLIWPWVCALVVGVVSAARTFFARGEPPHDVSG